MKFNFASRFIIWGKSESRKERERRTIPQMHPEQQPIFQEGLNGYQTQEQPCRNMLPPLMPRYEKKKQFIFQLYSITIECLHQ